VATAPVAAAEPTSITFDYSPYEWQAIRDAEAALGAGLDPAPEGKTIERVDFVRLDPVDRHDPVPMVLDRVHATSRPSVLRHELLVREGSAWSKVLVDESARNLRLLPQLSLVICVPMRGSTPGAVRLVVITKDVWSLYVDWDLQVANALLKLDLEPKETNFLGLHQTVLGRFVLEPERYSLGASYQAPRFAGRWLSFSADANVYFNRDSGSPEGHYGSVVVGRPLYSSRTEWAWATDVQWDDEIWRRYDSYANVMQYKGTVPYEWRQRTILGEAELLRSYGWRTKNDFAVGASVGDKSYSVPSTSGEPPSPAACSRTNAPIIVQFQCHEVPRGEARVGPFAQWHGYKSDFLRIIDFDTLGLQEDYRLGHDAVLRVYPVMRALGSIRDVLGTYAGAAYGVPLGDGIARLLVEGTVEATPDTISDAYLNTELGVATPRILGLGRLVLDLTFLDRFRNYLNAQTYLGQDSRLRGYGVTQFNGWDEIVGNLEFRSRPVELFSLQFGATAFYDVGDVFNSFDDIRPKQSVGAGLRVLFPQITRSVLRVDLGVPFMASQVPGGIQNSQVYVTFGQALSLPGPNPPGVGLPQ
jgi:hypothetical protein